MLYICIVIRGFKYRIYPNKEQEQQLNQMLGNARFVYNWALDRRIKEYQSEKKSISAFTKISVNASGFNRGMKALYFLLVFNVFNYCVNRYMTN